WLARANAPLKTKLVAGASGNPPEAAPSPDSKDVRDASGGATPTRMDKMDGEMTVVTGIDGRAVVNATPSEPFNLRLNEDGYGPSDHSSFYSKQVPVLLFLTR